MASLRPDFLVDLLSGFLPKKPMSSTRFSYISLILRFCPRNWGTPRARGCCSQSERRHSGREPKALREEPGKQRTRSCRAQEVARSGCSIERGNGARNGRESGDGRLGKRESKCTRGARIRILPPLEVVRRNAAQRTIRRHRSVD